MGEKGTFSRVGEGDDPNVSAPGSATIPSHLALVEGSEECALFLQDQDVVAITAPAQLLLKHHNLFNFDGPRLSSTSRNVETWLSESLPRSAGKNPVSGLRTTSRQLLFSTSQHDYVLTLLDCLLKPCWKTEANRMLLIHVYERASGGLPRELGEDASPQHAWKELGLTPTETAIAKLLLDGLSVVEIAKAQSVSREGVRFHIKGLLSKAQCNRQSQLVAILAKKLWSR